MATKRALPSRIVELRAEDWVTAMDFLGALKNAIGAPDWHGDSADAFLDSMIYHDDINVLKSPYQSARLTYFDAQLMSFAKPSWQRAVRLVGEAMMEWVGPEMEPYFQAGDGILANRVVALVESGLLEGRGNLLNMREGEVRLANQG